MNTRSKSALLLFATLIVGVLIGALGTSAVFNNRLDRLRDMQRRGGFVRAIEQVVEPVDEAQRAQIQAILERAGQQMQELGSEVRQQRVEILSTMRADLNQVLTQEQQDRLDTWLERDRMPRFRRAPRDSASHKRRRGPGPPS